MNKEIGQRIKYYRQLNNISRENLANKLEISIHTLAKYEQGQREANYETLSKLCSILNISIHDLFEEQSMSEEFYKNIFKQLHETSSTKEIVEFMFLHNDFLNTRLDCCISNDEDKEYFFYVVADFINNELRSFNLLNMPKIKEDDDGKL